MGAVREEVDLPPSKDIILADPSGRLEPCNNDQWKLRAVYNKRLEKAWKVFLEFTARTNSSSLPATSSTVLAFVAWMGCQEEY
ncbi:42585_t:CDS:2 [Gigaspora margarita]|uniref:42585_t:CDS:1 n=1 Tax=Gigaspora margarita TaxID=4874 RepID=A0ABN7UM22_GIGMA|nr:42585_t:CDS:2 [Gigaspora margarita]